MARRPPRVGAGRPDEELAERVALQALDLPGGGWDSDPAAGGTDAEAGGPGTGDDLDACLGAFPQDAVTASADSSRFTRGDALAYAVVWVLADAVAADGAAAALADPAFAHCFAARVAAAVAPPGAGAELLGHVVTAGAPLTPTGPTSIAGSGASSVAHHLRLAAATPDGVFDIHLHVLVLRRRRVVTGVFLADSPAPVASADLAAVAGRVLGRVPEDRSP